MTEKYNAPKIPPLQFHDPEGLGEMRVFVGSHHPLVRGLVKRSARPSGVTAIFSTDFEELDRADFVPVNYQQIAEVVQDEIARGFANRIANFADVNKSMLLVQREMVSLSQSVDVNFHAIGQLKEQLTKKIDELNSLVAASSSSIASARTDSETADLLNQPEVGEFVKDLTAYYRKEVWIVVGSMIAFLVGLVLLSIR